MRDVHCFTSISFSYLNRARVLANSIRKFHPDWIIWVCISDQQPPGFEFNLDNEPFDKVMWIKDIDIKNLDQWIYKHNVIELCTAVKGYVLRHILNTGAECVLYIDPDIVLFNSLDDVIVKLESSSILLTPHLIDPEINEVDVMENERGSLLHGVYNLGFIAVKNNSEGRRFADWWRDRLIMCSYEIASEGIYTDQRWCDLVPAFFTGVQIERHPGLNVASWNIGRRKIRFDREGTLRSNGKLLIFYHFTKIDTAGEAMISKNMGDSIAVLELVKWYRSAVKTASSKNIPDKWWSYGFYDNGIKIEYRHRVLYRNRKDLQNAFPEPFASGSYYEWISNNEPDML